MQKIRLRKEFDQVYLPIQEELGEVTKDKVDVEVKRSTIRF